MLSLTSDDMPNFTRHTPEEIRGAQQKALNLWVGAISPLWAPFWLASAVGVSLWSLGLGLRRFEESLRTASAASIDSGAATDVAGTVQTMVDDGVIAPIQATGKAIADMTSAATPSPQAIADQMKSTGDEVTAQAVEAAHAVTEGGDTATTRAVEQAEAQVDTQADAADDIAEDTGSLLPQGSLLPKGGAAIAAAADTAIAEADRPNLRKPKKS